MTPGLQPARDRDGIARSRRRRAVLALLVVCAALLVLRTTVTPLRVHGDSMRPTLVEGDIVLVLRFPDLQPALHGGELVVLDDDRGGLTLKRVVAVGGEQVRIRDAQLEVDGEPVHEPWLDPASIDGLYFGAVQVPHGSVFVMGDDRARSVDSRHEGAVPLDRVVGRVLVRLWPSPGRPG